MKRFLKKAASAGAIAAAAAGVAVLPASSAHADPQLPCPRVITVCTWTEPTGRGELRLLFEGREVILPPVRSAQNQTFEPWCFYEAPGFNGERRELQPQETAFDFGFPVHSAKPGRCY